VCSRDIENHMVLPYADDEPIPQREEPEFERDTSLVDEIKNIALLRAEIKRIESLVETLERCTYSKKQA